MRFVSILSAVFFVSFSSKLSGATNALASPLPIAAKQDSDSSRAFDEIFSKLRSEADLSVTFEQYFEKKLRKIKGKKTGRAYFQRPAKFRWVIDKPMASEWVYTGSDLVSFDPKTKQGISYSASGEKSRSLREIVDLILHPEALKQAYHILSVNKDKAKATLVISPKAKNEIEKIELIFDLDQSFVCELRLLFDSKNQTTFQFRKVKEKVDSSLFAIPGGLTLRKVS